MIGVIFIEEIHRKSASESTLGISLNAQCRGWMTKRGNNSKNHEKLKGNPKGKRSQSRGLRDF